MRDFRPLNILPSSVKKASDMSGRENVRRIPALDIIADDLVLYGKHLGRTEIIANNVNFQGGREWRINKLKITNPDAILDASGSWISSTGNKQQTKLNYVLNIRDAGKLLDRFGWRGIDPSWKRRNERRGALGWLAVRAGYPVHVRQTLTQDRSGTIPESGCRGGTALECYQSAIIAQKADP